MFVAESSIAVSVDAVCCLSSCACITSTGLSGAGAGGAPVSLEKAFAAEMATELATELTARVTRLKARVTRLEWPSHARKADCASSSEALTSFL